MKDALDKLPEESRTGYPKERSKLLCLFLFWKNAQICQKLKPRKAWSAMFLASFITMESSKISSSTADLYSRRSLSIVLGLLYIVVPQWLGGYRSGFWIRGWGFESSSLSIPYGLMLISIEIHEKKLSFIPPFLKSTWQKIQQQKFDFNKLKWRKC